MIREIQAKSLLRIHKRIDSWFLSRYGLNLYRGCFHDCAYCDGRSERYGTTGEFGRDVVVKTNAIDLLARELDPARRRKPLRRCFMTLGGGVGDAYQPIETRYGLARAVLGLFLERDWPVLVLTKSRRVLRDLDLLKRIHARTRSLVCVSLCALDRRISDVFEPGVPSPAERLEVVARCKAEGLDAGVFLMPVIPYVSDGAEEIEAVLAAAKRAGADFVMFGGMTLKPDRQRAHFMRVIENGYPHLATRIRSLYGNDPWGQPRRAYQARIQSIFAMAVKRVGMAPRMPPRIWGEFLDTMDRAVVILEHMDYLLRLNGHSSNHARDARLISGFKGPASSFDLETARGAGVSGTSLDVISEVLNTGRSSRYESLLRRATVGG